MPTCPVRTSSAIGTARKVSTPSTTTGTARKVSASGANRGGVSVSYKESWNVLKAGVGQDFSSVLRMLIGYWNTGNMSNGVESYLRSLYDKYGGSVSWEDWLLLLRKAWLANSGVFISAGKPKAAPKPRYSNTNSGRGSSGIRRI